MNVDLIGMVNIAFGTNVDLIEMVNNKELGIMKDDLIVMVNIAF